MALALAPLLLSLAVPIVKKVLTTLGIGIISYAAISTVITGIRSLLESQLGTLTADISGLVGLFGLYDFIGIILAAVTTRLSLQPLKRWGIIS